MGVALITSTCGRISLVVSASLCFTPKRCCLPVITRPRFSYNYFFPGSGGSSNDHICSLYLDFSIDSSFSSGWLSSKKNWMADEISCSSISFVNASKMLIWWVPLLWALIMLPDSHFHSKDCQCQNRFSASNVTLETSDIRVCPGKGLFRSHARRLGLLCSSDYKEAPSITCSVSKAGFMWEKHWELLLFFPSGSVLARINKEFVKHKVFAPPEVPPIIWNGRNE